LPLHDLMLSYESSVHILTRLRHS